MFGANPWEWLDYRNQELFETWANNYEINGGTWRLETDLKSLNGIPRNGTVYVNSRHNKIYGVGTNFKDVFCGGQAGAAVGTPYIVPLVPEGRRQADAEALSAVRSHPAKAIQSSRC